MRLLPKISNRKLNALFVYQITSVSVNDMDESKQTRYKSTEKRKQTTKQGRRQARQVTSQPEPRGQINSQRANKASTQTN